MLAMLIRGASFPTPNDHHPELVVTRSPSSPRPARAAAHDACSSFMACPLSLPPSLLAADASAVACSLYHQRMQGHAFSSRRGSPLLVPEKHGLPISLCSLFFTCMVSLVPSTCLVRVHTHTCPCPMFVAVACALRCWGSEHVRVPLSLCLYLLYRPCSTPPPLSSYFTLICIASRVSMSCLCAIYIYYYYEKRKRFESETRSRRCKPQKPTERGALRRYCSS